MGHGGVKDFGFEQWTQRARLELEYMDWIGDLRLKLAKERNIDANTGLQYATLEAKELGVRQAAVELARLRISRASKDQGIKRLEEMGARLRYFRMGDAIGDKLRADMWKAWSVLIRFATDDVINSWVDLRVDLRSEDLVWRSLFGDVLGEEPLAWGSHIFPALMRELHLHWTRCVPKMGSPLWVGINQGLALAADSQSNGIELLKAAIKDMEQTQNLRLPVLELVKLTASCVM